MSLTAIGEAVLEIREGRRLVAYRDSKGIPTIGVGVTTIDGKPVRMGMTLTEAECDELFAKTLARYEAAVDRGVTVQLADHERDAFASICYNIGVGTPKPKKGEDPGFLGSTFLKRFNAGDRDGCAAAILSWNKPAEIITRRTAERDQFLTPYAKSPPRARSTDKALITAPAHLIAAPAAPSICATCNRRLAA